MALKLQSATGIEALSEKNVAAAFKGRPGAIKSFIAAHTFEAKLWPLDLIARSRLSNINKTQAIIHLILEKI